MFSILRFYHLWFVCIQMLFVMVIILIILFANAVVPSERKKNVVINGLFRLNPFGLFADFVDKKSQCKIK